MDDQLPIDFYFGDQSSENIALASHSLLVNYKGKLNNIFSGAKLIWQRKAIRKAFSKRYSHYILTGNTGILSNWIIILICRLLDRKTILWTHGLYGDEKGLKRFKNLLYLRLANQIFTYNERGKYLLIQNGVKKSKIITIYNSLDYEKQIKLLERIGDSSFAKNYFGNNDKIVTFIGRLTHQKKIDILLEAASKSNEKYNIIIIGDGPCKGELEKLVEKLELQDRVWFYGECYDDSMIATIIANSQLTVSPGNCGLNAIESLTYGTPMITHSNMTMQMPEAEAVVELCKKSGRTLLFEDNNIDNLTDIIDKNITLDNRLVKDMAQQIINDKWNANRQIEIMVHNLR